MHRRHQHINIPTEIVRTVVVIAEAGSFSKAGDRLGLSQPAISAQVKRLQILVGGPVFEKVAGGVAFTPRGKLVLAQARKLLDANDQILSLGGAAQDAQPLRIGLSTLYVEDFLPIWRKYPTPMPVNFYCDASTELAKGLLDGYLDIACLLAPPQDQGEQIANWREDFVWVRANDFVLSPGSPIPLITWPGAVADLPMVNALEKAGLAYRVVFTSSDHHARVSATAAGIGIMGLPRRQIAEPLQVANEYYLPPIEDLSSGIVLRHGIDAKSVKPVTDLLRALAPDSRRLQDQAAS